MSAEERAEKSTQRMAETLELNEEQKEKVLAATMRQIESMDEVQSREERMKGMQKAMETYEQEMQEILTEKQYEEFQIMRRKRLKRMRQRRRMMGEEEGFSLICYPMDISRADQRGFFICGRAKAWGSGLHRSARSQSAIEFVRLWGR